MWHNGYLSLSPHVPGIQGQSWSNPFFKFYHNSAAATPPSSKLCNLTFFKQVFFFFGGGATKQAISIKLSTTVGHFYVTLTVKTFIWLAIVILCNLLRQCFQHAINLLGIVFNIGFLFLFRGNHYREFLNFNVSYVINTLVYQCF